MIELKLRARKAINGHIFSLFMRHILRCFILVCSVISFIPCFLGCFYDVFPTINGRAEKIFLCLLGLSSVFLFVFSYILKCVNNAHLFHMCDKNTAAPDSFFSFYQGIRYLTVSFFRVTLKALWALIFFTPPVFLSVCLFSAVYSGEMLSSVFFTLVSADILLFITGGIFYITASGRYYLCSFLFFLNPLTSPREIIRSSVLLMKSRLLFLLRARLSLVPWAVSGLFLPCLPFCMIYLKTQSLLISEMIYGEKKCFGRKNAVTFYINSHTVIKKHSASTPGLPILGTEGVS